jgi:hypothetical protein
VLTKGAKPLLDLGPLKFPFDELTIGAIGNIVLFVVGAAVSLLTSRHAAEIAADPGAGTVWHWLRNRRTARGAVS